jgi:hypothetical protein
MSKRPALDISLRVTAPAGMPAAAIRREVLTRINDLTGHYSAFDFRLSDQAEGPDGNLRIKASRLRQKPVAAAARSNGELLALAKLFAETIRYEQRRSAKEGDDEGVTLKGFTLARVETAIAAAEGREIADTPKAEPALADFEQRRDGWLIAFVPISSAARQWSIDASPKGARWEHERWYASRSRAPAVRHAIEADGFTVREG